MNRGKIINHIFIYFPRKTSWNFFSSAPHDPSGKQGKLSSLNIEPDSEGIKIVKPMNSPASGERSYIQLMTAWANHQGWLDIYYLNVIVIISILLMSAYTNLACWNMLTCFVDRGKSTPTSQTPSVTHTRSLHLLGFETRLGNDCLCRWLFNMFDIYLYQCYMDITLNLSLGDWIINYQKLFESIKNTK